LANLNLIELDPSISKVFSEVTILLAIPLLLYATDIRAWLKYARSTVLSFGLCVLSGILSSIMIALFFKGQLGENWILSGMLVGVYTGGTPNMNAIGLALGAKNETIVLMNAADVVCGGIYLLFLTSVAYPVFSKFLPAFKKTKPEDNEKETPFKTKITGKGIFEALFLTILIAGVSLGICKIFAWLDNIAILLLLLTSFSILASFSPKVRAISGTFEMGEYLLLMFCVAIGMEANFSHLIAEGSLYIGFTALVLTITVILHLLMARLFKIDADTLMITSTAALYGPVFIGQIAGVIKNRALIFSGMVTGLVGYAIGNYLGIAVAYFVKWLTA
jgi:uncharacterized membrane protein